MPAGPLHLASLLRSLFGTAPFARYCEERGIILPRESGPGTAGDFGWGEALRRLPDGEQARVELELAQVRALARPAGLALLCAALPGPLLPADSVPGGAALALWFCLHHPGLFRSAYLQQELGDTASWRAARVPAGRPIDPLLGRRAALGESLREFFRALDGTGRSCAVDAFALPDAACFVAYLAGRPQVLDVFTDGGAHATALSRPAFSLVYLYSPADGRLLLQTRQRSPDRVLDLVRRFGRAVLGAEPGDHCLAPAFRLDLLKRRFDPPPDGPDMERVRVRTIHLAYPERSGRRRVKLETLAGDSPEALDELLQEHGGRGTTLDDLTVLYAELEVWVWRDGHRAPHVVRLWPDRSNLGHDPFGVRLRACLKRWGLDHAG